MFYIYLIASIATICLASEWQLLWDQVRTETGESWRLMASVSCDNRRRIMRLGVSARELP